MSGRISQPMPVAPGEYGQVPESVFRRQIEANFEQTNIEVEDAKGRTSAKSSLAIRRFQFLLMGASSG